MRLSIIVCLFQLSIAALAGTHVVYTVTRAPVQSLVHVHIEGKSLRISYEGEQGEMIFDGERRLLLMLDHDQRGYVELNARMMAAFARQLDGQYERIEKAKDQIEQRLARVPAEYRETMREILHQKLAGLPQAPGPVLPPVTKDMGPGEDIDGYKTQLYEVYENDQKDLALWTTDPGALGLKSFSGFQDVAGFFQEIKRVAGGDQFLSRVDSPFRMFQEVKGFPIRIEKFRDGASVEVSRLSKVETKDYEPGYFGVPQGYQVLNPFQK